MLPISYKVNIPLGARYMLLSVIGFAGMNACIKMLPHIPVMQITFFRAIISLLMSYWFLYKNDIHIWGNNKSILIARGITGTVGLTAFITTLHNMPLATALTLQYLSPIFTTLIASLFLGEKSSPLRWGFFILSFVGVIVIKGFDTNTTELMMALGIFSAFASGLSYNLIRKLNTSEHPLVIVFYFPLITLPVSLFFCWDWILPNVIDFFILLLVGIFTQIGQVYLTKAYQIEKASRIAPISYTGVVYATLLGYFVFGEMPNVMTFVGIALVVSGVILNVLYKEKN